MAGLGAEPPVSCIPGSVLSEVTYFLDFYPSGQQFSNRSGLDLSSQGQEPGFRAQLSGMRGSHSTLRNAVSHWLTGTHQPMRPAFWGVDAAGNWAHYYLPLSFPFSPPSQDIWDKCWGARAALPLCIPSPNQLLRACCQRTWSCLPLPFLLRLPELVDHEGEAIRQPHGGDAARREEKPESVDSPGPPRAWPLWNHVLPLPSNEPGLGVPRARLQDTLRLWKCEPGRSWGTEGCSKTGSQLVTTLRPLSIMLLPF